MQVLGLKKKSNDEKDEGEEEEHGDDEATLLLVAPGHAQAQYAKNGDKTLRKTVLAPVTEQVHVPLQLDLWRGVSASNNKTNVVAEVQMKLDFLSGLLFAYLNYQAATSPEHQTCVERLYRVYQETLASTEFKLPASSSLAGHKVFCYLFFVADVISP